MSEMLVFSPHEMKYIIKFSFYFILNGKYRKHNLTLSFDFFSVFIGYNIGC